VEKLQCSEGEVMGRALMDRAATRRCWFRKACMMLEDCKIMNGTECVRYDIASIGYQIVSVEPEKRRII
jgi:hypothetical protein